MKSVLEDVAGFIARLAPEPVCDECIAERLALSARQSASHSTRELAGARGFTRSKGACSLCDAVKLVTRHG
jgi:hypothetical protein